MNNKPRMRRAKQQHWRQWLSNQKCRLFSGIKFRPSLFRFYDCLACFRRNFIAKHVFPSVFTVFIQLIMTHKFVMINHKWLLSLMVMLMVICWFCRFFSFFLSFAFLYWFLIAILYSNFCCRQLFVFISLMLMRKFYRNKCEQNSCEIGRGNKNLCKLRGFLTFATANLSLAVKTSIYRCNANCCDCGVGGDDISFSFILIQVKWQANLSDGVT